MHKKGRRSKKVHFIPTECRFKTPEAKRNVPPRGILKSSTPSPSSSCPSSSTKATDRNSPSSSSNNSTFVTDTESLMDVGTASDADEGVSGKYSDDMFGDLDELKNILIQVVGDKSKKDELRHKVQRLATQVLAECGAQQLPESPEPSALSPPPLPEPHPLEKAPQITHVDTASPSDSPEPLPRGAPPPQPHQQDSLPQPLDEFCKPGPYAKGCPSKSRTRPRTLNDNQVANLEKLDDYINLLKQSKSA